MDQTMTAAVTARTDAHVRPGSPPTEVPARRLRLVLTANAATSFAAGVAGLVAAPWWADTLGIDSTGWLRVVAAGLVLFAVDVALGARSSPRLRATALLTSIADLAWVAGTGVALATIDFTGTGTAVAVVMGIGVLDFAMLQLWFRSRLD